MFFIILLLLLRFSLYHWTQELYLMCLEWLSLYFSCFGFTELPVQWIYNFQKFRQFMSSYLLIYFLFSLFFSSYRTIITHTVSNIVPYNTENFFALYFSHFFSYGIQLLYLQVHGSLRLQCLTYEIFISDLKNYLLILPWLC